MKKITAIILSALFICTSLLCGCSSEESKPQSSPAEASSTVKEKEALALEKGTTYTFKTKEIWCENNGNKIYGIAYIPDTNKKCPLVITCHGLGTNHEAGIGYAEHYAKIGVAAYTFDFCGGTKSSDTNRSDGKSTDMSVMTESADLEAVFNTAQTWNFVDTSRIFFQGGSQGGLVSAITGVRLKDKIAGMILLYPAFGMYDFVHRAYPSYESISGTMEIVNDMVIGEAFGKDLWNYDVREHLSEFTKPVIIIQGTEDSIVLPSVTEQAAKLIPNCEMKLINGAGHGFGGKELDEAANYAMEYLYKNC